MASIRNQSAINRMAKKRVFVVYVIRNLLDGQRYIGKTSGRNWFAAVEVRWRRHLSLAASGGGWHLHHAMRKYGVENFEIGHLHICATERAAFAVEVKEIARLAPAYNMTKGGEGVAGRQWTEEQRAAASQRNSARWQNFTSEQKASALECLRQNPPKYDAAHRRNLSKAMSGKTRIITEAECRRRSEALVGKPLTAEHRRNISLSKVGKPYRLTKLRAATIAIKQAREGGAKFYSTGVPCQVGHLSPRYVSTRQCCECHRTRDAVMTSKKQMELSYVR